MPAGVVGLNFIRLATPTTDDRRLPSVLNNTSGFVYYVSLTGITGAAIADYSRSARRSKRIKGPRACPSRSASGSRRPTMRATIGAQADGVVVGTALVDALKKSPDAQNRATARRSKPSPRSCATCPRRARARKVAAGSRS